MLFLQSAARGDAKKCGELLTADGLRNLDVNTADYDQRTALHVAAAEGHVDVVSFLLSEGAVSNCKDRWGKTPLDDALFFGHESVVMILRAHGAVLGSPMADSVAKLCEAAKQNNVVLIKRLVLCGVNVNQSDYDSRTPLHIAAAEGNLEAAKVLLLLGSEPLMKDRWASTPLNDAQKAGHEQVAKFLSYYSGDHTIPPVSPSSSSSSSSSSSRPQLRHGVSSPQFRHSSSSSRSKSSTVIGQAAAAAAAAASPLSISPPSPLSLSSSSSVLNTPSPSNSPPTSPKLTSQSPSSTGAPSVAITPPPASISPPVSPRKAGEDRSSRPPNRSKRKESSSRRTSCDSQRTSQERPTSQDLAVPPPASPSSSAEPVSPRKTCATSSSSVEPTESPTSDGGPETGAGSGNTDDPMDIEYSELAFEREISHGSFGVVFFGRWNGQEVAIKEIRSTSADEQQEKIMILQLRREIASLNRIQHPNVVRFIGACFVPPKVALVTEFIKGDTLLAYLKNFAKTPKGRGELLSHAIQIGLQIAKGMAHAHMLQIVHRDLKSPNIMIEQDTNRVVIIDFGSARVVHASDSHMTKGVGSFRWIAPELFLSSQYNEKVDVFSFGVILWEILHPGQIPLAHYTPVEAAYAAAQRKVRPAVSAPLSSAFTKLLRACWHQESKNRPSFASLVEIFETRTVSLMKPPKTGLKRLLS